MGEGQQDRVARFLGFVERERATMEELAERVASGESMVDVCAAWDVPFGRFAAWVSSDARRRETYEMAQAMYGDSLAAATVKIADEGGGNVQHARARVAARQWVASKWFRERYGDAVQVEHTGDVVVRLSFGGRVIDQPSAAVKQEMGRALALQVDGEIAGEDI